MTNYRAAVGSALFLVVAPGVVTGLVPFWLTGWTAGAGWWPPLRVVGAVLVAAGMAVLLHAFARFVVEGRGTPAPVAPTAELVVGGLYRYVRNPMYLAVLSLLVGQALLLSRPVLLAYAAVVGVSVVGFVRGYEEPTLHEQFGRSYDTYRDTVPGWGPRLSPRRPPPA